MELADDVLDGRVEIGDLIRAVGGGSGSEEGGQEKEKLEMDLNPRY